jgi:Fe-S cluster assembly iron-binding protein IscA
MEINITEMAQVKIREFAAANNEEPVIRIYVEKAACSGARFGIAIDNFRTGDEITQKGDIKIFTDSEYVPIYSDGINIDYTVKPKEGFIISSCRPVKKANDESCSSGGCGGCSKLKNK